MSTTTESASTQTKTKKEGVQIKGRDVIYLNAPEICFPENAPLKNTEKRELYAILDELFQCGSGGGDEDWHPPDWWIPVPEPGEYEILILVWVTNTDNQFAFSLGNTSNLGSFLLDADGNIAQANINIDWGDGTTDTANTGNYGHVFKEAGQYLVKITAQEGLNVFCAKSLKNCFWQIVKTGSSILYKLDTYTGVYGTPLSDHHGLKYIKINNANGIPFDETYYYFEYDYALQKIELKKPMSGNVPNGCFRNNNFTDLNQLPLDGNSVVNVGDYAFADCRSLKKIILPNCTSIGNYAFQNCYNLQEIVVADDCTFGTNCFQNCYSLYPRPDGSVN